RFARNVSLSMLLLMR
ncbi:hypothetical protein, partial [Escherichia coli]